MVQRSMLVIALAAGLAVAPAALADDTLSGALVDVGDDGRTFTIQTAAGERHEFLAPPSIDVRALETGTELEVTAQPITDVARNERRQATAVAVLPPDEDAQGRGGEGGGAPNDPASGGAPGGGPPSGGIPGGGVPSGGSGAGPGIPSGGGAGGIGP
ncbi:MAG TPA: hypothetical protein VIN04_07095 [Myxococcota bacterium]